MSPIDAQCCLRPSVAQQYPSSRSARLLLLIAAAAIAVITVQGTVQGTEDEGNAVVVRTGPELAAAFANHSVSLALVDASIVLTNDDWAGISPQPVLLRRNFTIRGSTAAPATWPQLTLTSTSKKKVQLLDGVTFRLAHVIMYMQRKDNFLRTPGMDLLAPSPPGTINAFLVGDEAASMLDVCYPRAVLAENYAGVVRPPGVPGTQNFSIGVPQPGCVNDTSAPTLLRCWPSKNREDDIQMSGADPDSATGKPSPNGYGVKLLKCVSLCITLLSEACIAEYGPIGCNLVTRAAVAARSAAAAGTPPPLPPRPDAAATPAGVATQSDASTAGTGTSGSQQQTAGVIAGSIIGGTLLLVGALMLWAIVWRKQQRRRQAITIALAATKKMMDGPAAVVSLSTWSKGHVTADFMTASDGDSGGRHSPPPMVAAVVVTTDTPICPGISTSIRVEDSAVLNEPLGSAGEPAAGGGRTAGGATVVPASSFGTAAKRSSSSAAGNGRQRHAAADGAGTPPVDVVKLLPNVLGKGAFGRVYEGTYRGQRVAVKQVLDLPEGVDLDDDGIHESFAQELEVLGRCQHPNILRVLAASLPPRPCLVMELMEMSLDKLLYTRLLPMPLVLHVASKIALGLAYLHPTILHRDLKPANVLINDPWGEQPVVKLSDFGLSRLLGALNTALITVSPEAGTPAYVAPECYDLHNTRITHQADIYAFGVVLWEMLAGSRPWEGLGVVPIACQVTLLGRRLPVPPSNAPGSCSSRWPPQLCQLLDECWDRDPERRPAAAELAKRLMLVQQKMQGSASAQGLQAI